MLIPSMTHAVPGYVGQSYVFNWPAVFLMPYYRIGVAARTAARAEEISSKIRPQIVMCEILSQLLNTRHMCLYLP